MGMTISESTTFLITDQIGDVPKGNEYGLYTEDTRVLSEYQLRLRGLPPVVLSARTTSRRSAEHFLTNHAFEGSPRSTIGIVRRRRLERALHEALVFTNFGGKTLDLVAELSFAADFGTIASIKQNVQMDQGTVEHEGEYHCLVEDGGRLLRYTLERDGFHRELHIHLPPEAITAPGSCLLPLHLEPGSSQTFHLTFTFGPAPKLRKVTPLPRPAGAPAAPIAEGEEHAELLERAPTLETDSPVLREAYERSVRDFAALRLRADAIEGDAFVIAGGIPWYLALFGRDSLVASYMALPFLPEVASGTMRALAALQGEGEDEERGEEPGKIAHEHRFGTTITAVKHVPPYPHYKTVDATPLFLITLATSYHITGDLPLVRALWPNALRALEWMERYGDRDGDGYLEYPPGKEGKIASRGWKDSNDSVRFHDGRLAHGSIALCEVQGYAYAARLGMAALAEAMGEGGRATELRKGAEQLKTRVNQDYWLEKRHFFAEALDGEKHQVDALTSNPGQMLWTGIVEREKAAAVAQALLSPPLFSGWGVRTLATTEVGYNPIAYQIGAVWPHDNALIASGLARYGFLDEASRIARGLLDALAHAADRRLPELFAGYGKDEASAPVQYPLACRPQAWASGAVFLLLSTMIGLAPAVGADADDPLPGEPFLPPGISHLRVSGLWIDGKQGTITLTRTDDGGVRREVER
jgi:glycogen debranching enzyme